MLQVCTSVLGGEAMAEAGARGRSSRWKISLVFSQRFRRRAHHAANLKDQTSSQGLARFTELQHFVLRNCVLDVIVVFRGHGYVEHRFRFKPDHFCDL